MRASPLFLAGLVAAVAAVAGCDDPTGGSAGADGVLAGSVALAKTGEGVRDAVVALLRDGHVVAASPTDADGVFSFDDLADGTYTARLVGLELTRLSPLHTVFEPAEQTVSLTGEAEPLLFAAVGIVPGRVTGIVSCGGAVRTDGAVRVVGGVVDTVVTTNEVGRYALTDLEPGHYVLFPQAPACLEALAPVVVRVEQGQYVGVDLDG